MAAAETSGDGQLIISRVLDAPRELVFKAFTQDESLARWWGPKGFTMLSTRLDFRPGGTFLYGMRSPDGAEMWGIWVFQEIAKPELLSFVVSFCDPQGNIVRAPFSAEWPLKVLSTITFTENAGKTTLSMTGVPIDATEAEYRMFAGFHASMQQGWAGTFDQLAEELARAQEGGNA